MSTVPVRRGKDLVIRVSLDNGVPAAMANVDEYIRCVNHCKGTFAGPDLTECIRGCAQVSRGDLRAEVEDRFIDVV